MQMTVEHWRKSLKIFPRETKELLLAAIVHDTLQKMDRLWDELPRCRKSKFFIMRPWQGKKTNSQLKICTKTSSQISD